MTGVEEVGSLTKASIEVAQAASDYGALKVIFGCFMVMVILQMVQQWYSSWEFRKRIKAIEDACMKTMGYFSELNNRTVGKEEAKMIVREALDKEEALMKYNILKMRIENHLTDTEMVETKIRDIVQNEANSRKLLLSRFVCLGHSMNFTCTDAANDTTMKMVKEWVYKKEDTFTVSLMAQALSLYFDGLRLNATAKIDEVA